MFQKMKNILSLFVIGTLLISSIGTAVIPAPAHAGDEPVPQTYYFNNAVNTDPTELGNYWNDAGLTDPALSLPDFSIDAVTVVSGATVNGNFSFRGDAANYGTVNGDATFYEDASENHGTVTGLKIRYYTVEIATERSFITDGPWRVIADGVSVALNGRNPADDRTDFGLLNGGAFYGLDCDFSTVIFNNDKVYIVYSGNLNIFSVPDPSDFSVTADGVNVPVSSVTVSGKRVTLSMSSAISSSSQVSLNYTAGEQPIISMLNVVLGDITAQNAIFGVMTGDAPVYALAVGDKLYVSNNHSSSITVINTKTNQIIKTIEGDSYPEFSWIVGHKIYTTNRQSASVTVIDSDTDTLLTSIDVGFDPYFSTVVGTKLYVSVLGTGKIAVIDTDTDTVSSQIDVGTTPFFSTSVGHKLYVPVAGSNIVSVIDTTSDEVLTTIPVGAYPVYAARVGTKLYINNMNSDSVSVIDTLTDTVVTTLAVGDQPRFSGVVGKKVYIPNMAGSTVTVIDADTDTVSSTVTVGLGPFSVTVYGDKAYVNNEQGASISVIDSTTDTVLETIDVGEGPFYSSIGKKNLYVSNNRSSSVAIIPTDDTPRLQPNLVSFTTTAADGVYTAGQSIPLIAQFGHTLQAGSTMTVRLNTGDNVTLGTVSGSTLRGTYVVSADDQIIDLAVEAIVSANVSDTRGNNNTHYDMPSSQGDFTGENSFITRNLGDAHNISIRSYRSIAVGANPYQVTAPVTVGGQQYVYVANQGDATVSVIRLSDYAVVATIPVGDEPYGVTLVTKSGTVYVYVANTLSNDVSVINTATNTVVATIAVGVKPYYVEHIGTKVYVTNGQSNTVSVIDGNSNTVSATIPVGSYPRGIKAHGTDLYVANYGDPNYSGGDTVSVISSLTDTVTDTIILPGEARGPRGVTVGGNFVYVANYRSGSVTRIDTSDNTVKGVISVGRGPRGVTTLGNKLYVENFDEGTISIVDRGSDIVTKTLYVGHSPAGMGVAGTNILVSRFQDNLVSVLNTVTDTLRWTDETAPEISNVDVSELGSEDVAITWNTDEAATSTIRYGTTEEYGSSVLNNNLVTRHTLRATGLQPDTLYNYQVVSADQNGNQASSTNGQFRTAGSGSSGGGGGGIIIPIVKPVVTPAPIPVPMPEPLPEPAPSSGGSIPSVSLFNKDLQYGDKGSEVKRLQDFLIARKFLAKGNNIGLYGRLTQTAIKKFQTQYKIKPLNGRFGPLSRAAANRLLAAKK